MASRTPYNFRFSNLCGTVYKSGNLAFKPDGTTLYSPVGNRVSALHLVAHSAATLDFETRSDIERIAVSPDGRLLLAVDADGHALAFNLARGVVVHRFAFRARARALAFSPDGRFFAVSHGRRLQVWRTPSLASEFSPFALHRTYTGHYDDVTCVAWSPSGAYLCTGSEDLTARIHSLHPTQGFIPVALSGHRERLVSVHFSGERELYTVSRDGAIFVWRWVERPELSAAAAASLRAQQRARDGGEGEEGGEDEGEEEGEEEEEELEEEDEEREEGTAGAGESAPAAGVRRKRERVEEGAEAAAGGAPSGEQSWNTAARIRAGGAVSSLATRVRHPVPAPDADPLSVLRGEWLIAARHYFRAEEHARLTSAAFHAPAGLLVAGFSSGVFSLHTLPDFAPIHSLSISSHALHTAVCSSDGSWLAFGSRTLGQLLVWEWRSESYIVKQQGHYFDVNASAFSPSGQLVCTGGDDGKVKVWNAATGFCFVTFGEAHKGPVTAVAFVGGGSGSSSSGGGGGHGLAVLSASLDGTVRAFDLVRYRNFRTLAPPAGSPPCAFTCLAADEAGEIVCAGGADPFNIYLWSLQTGRLLEVLTGHGGPISALSYSSARGVLASGSWDGSVRLWELFNPDAGGSGGAAATAAGTQSRTVLTHGSPITALALRGDGGVLAVAQLLGGIALWDTRSGVQTGTLGGAGDVGGGRRRSDLLPAAARASARHFVALAFSPDGSALLAGGRSKWLCLYSVGDKGAGRLLLRRWVLSRNRSLDGVLDKLHSRGLGEGGVNLAVLDAENAAEEAEREERAGGGGGGGRAAGGAAGASGAAAPLPGVASRALHPEVRCKGLCFSPTGRAFSAATTEGLLLFDADAELVWEPLDLQEEATPEGVARAIASGAFARALLLALALGEPAHLSAALLATPLLHVPLVATTIPLVFLGKVVDAVAVALMPSTRQRAGAATGGAGSSGGGGSGAAAPPTAAPPAVHESSPHLHLMLVWARALLQHHAVALRSRPAHFAPHVRALQRALGAQREGLGRLAESTRHQLAFLCAGAGGGSGAQRGRGRQATAEEEVGEGEEDEEDEEDVEDEEEEEEEGAFSSWRAPQTAL